MEEKVMVSSDLRRKQQIRLLKDNNSVLILILILAAAFIFPITAKASTTSSITWPCTARCVWAWAW